MNTMAWVSLAGAVVSLIVGLTVLFNFSVARRKAAMEEGQKQQQFQQVKDDVQRAFDKIHNLETESRTSEKSLIEIVTKLDGIEKTLNKLSDKLDRHCEEKDHA